MEDDRRDKGYSDEGSDEVMDREALARAQATEPLPEGEEPNYED